MKTIVMGKKVKNTYEVAAARDENDMFLSKPTIILAHIDTKWEKITEYDGCPQNSFEDSKGVFCIKQAVWLSEDEYFLVEKEFFRADLGCWIQRIDKELDHKDNYKVCEKKLKPLLEEYNVQMIENDSKAKAYCDIHKLNYAETDYDELIEIMEPKTEKCISVTSLECAPTYFNVDVNKKAMDCMLRF